MGNSWTIKIVGIIMSGKSTFNLWFFYELTIDNIVSKISKSEINSNEFHPELFLIQLLLCISIEGRFRSGLEKVYYLNRKDNLFEHPHNLEEFVTSFEKLGVSLNDLLGLEPFQDLKAIFELRNAFTHCADLHTLIEENYKLANVLNVAKFSVSTNTGKGRGYDFFLKRLHKHGLLNNKKFSQSLEIRPKIENIEEEKSAISADFYITDVCNIKTILWIAKVYDFTINSITEQFLNININDAKIWSTGALGTSNINNRLDLLNKISKYLIEV